MQSVLIQAPKLQWSVSPLRGSIASKRKPCSLPSQRRSMSLLPRRYRERLSGKSAAEANETEVPGLFPSLSLSLSLPQSLVSD